MKKLPPLTDLHVWQMPKQRLAYRARYWTIKEAANAWGVSYRTALRWIERHPDCAVCTYWGKHGVIRMRIGIPVGTKKVHANTGNPGWRNSDYQRALINRRWAKRR